MRQDAIAKAQPNSQVVGGILVLNLCQVDGLQIKARIFEREKNEAAEQQQANIELARKNGARTIAVTNYPDSAIAQIVDVVLCSTAQNSPLLGENATARIEQLNLLDALFVATAQHDRKTADLNLSRTMRAVQSKRKL